MRFSFLFVVPIAVIFAANLATSSTTGNKQSVSPFKAIGKMVCNVNLVQETNLSKTIKKFEKKLENFITRMEKLFPPKPTPPGIFAVHSCMRN